MDSLTKTIQNNILDAFGTKAPENVLNAIKKASAATGVNFAYMLQQAGVESSFNPAAKAKSSSASGLYQFISSTWMDMINRHGDKYGIDTTGMSKQDILALRTDPEVSAQMAAEFASDNQDYLNKTWGGKVGPTELYLAHFMGAGGAAAFLKAKDQNALQPAANLMPQAARANRNIFFDSAGRAKSIDEVYAFFDKKFSVKTDYVPQVEDANTEEPVAAIAPPESPQTIQLSTIYSNGVPPSSNYARFNARRETGSLMPNQMPGQIPTAYQNLIRTPVDVMLLTQLALPGQGKNNGGLF